MSRVACYTYVSGVGVAGNQPGNMGAVSLRTRRQPLDRTLTVRQPHMASAAVIGETDNGLNPLRGLAKAHASRQV